MESMFRVISNVLLCLSIGAFSAGCNEGGYGSSGATCEGSSPPGCNPNCPVGKKCEETAVCRCVPV